ncbi:MAG TPA: iron uptake transporter permease EfeU [Galbitalea sp.]|jgi:high-affinity iron transporter
MLATLVIGLREGLEASLIVGIIAAFLKRTGKPLRPMWIGVGIAVALSIAVGVILQVVSASLPQAQQEGMESIIGIVAVAAVTGMIGWMNVHARNMRAELEQHAQLALRDGTAWALVGMAFLAVLKEGFETSVFLLAAFQSSTSFLGASAGAVIGVAIAVAIGIGIFRGGVKLNLARFFRITGIFLVLVAAGLVLSSLRTAHEAGWIEIGQQATINLGWLAPNGSVQAALLTGVLGIPADPRLIEVLGWLAYLIPTMLFLLWPLKRRPKGRALASMRLVIAAALALTAAVLAVAVTLPTYAPPTTASVRSADGSTTSVSVPVNLATARETTHEGVISRVVTTTASAPTPGRPKTLTLDQLVALSGGRLPIGISAAQNPGPYTANWLTRSTTSVWVYRAGVLDAKRTATTIVTLSGGGLPAPRTVTPDSAQTGSWALSAATRSTIAARIADSDRSASELLLWKLWIPLVLTLAALVLCFYVLRPQRRRTPRIPQKKAKETYA